MIPINHSFHSDILVNVSIAGLQPLSNIKSSSSSRVSPIFIFKSLFNIEISLWYLLSKLISLSPRIEGNPLENLYDIRYDR